MPGDKRNAMWREQSASLNKHLSKTRVFQIVIVSMSCKNREIRNNRVKERGQHEVGSGKALLRGDLSQSCEDIPFSNFFEIIITFYSYNNLPR